MAIFGADHVWIFHKNIIRGAVHSSLVEDACISITPFNVVVFASEVFHSVLVDVADYGGACRGSIIPAQEAYLIDEGGCLGGNFDILALRRPVIIWGDQVLI